MIMPSYAFDVDGVLVDPRGRIRRVLSYLNLSPDVAPSRLKGSIRRRFWELFLSDRFLCYDKPRATGINLLLERLSRGSVFIVTGRPETMRKSTYMELISYGVPVSKVRMLFRRRGDFRKDYEVKVELLGAIPDLVEVHDDSAKVLDAIALLRPRIRLYLHYDDSYMLYRGSS
ncbi:MAG: hypothetical protein J7L11_07520 [Thermoprotei archaeon]|nr:hypothetical protein [Thermoprotei archaeon]